MYLSLHRFRFSNLVHISQYGGTLYPSTSGRAASAYVLDMPRIMKQPASSADLANTTTQSCSDKLANTQKVGGFWRWGHIARTVVPAPSEEPTRCPHSNPRLLRDSSSVHQHNELLAPPCSSAPHQITCVTHGNNVLFIEGHKHKHKSGWE